MTARIPNPSGGPAAMLTDAIGRIAVVESRVDAVTAEVGRTADMVATVQRTQADQQHQITTLADQISMLGGQAGGEDEAEVVDWSRLDRAAAERAWDRLYEWVDGWLVPTYEITVGQLRVCWPHHPAVREELSWLHSCWVAAYRSEDATPAAAAEWHTRWLPNCLDRIAGHFTRYGCTGGRHGEHHLPAELREAITDRSLSRAQWWLHDGRDEDLYARP